MDGIILIDKDKDWTSQDVCSKVKRILNTRKVGHTGTLDPFATGLLILTIGSATKIGQFIESLNKSYIASMKLGVKTSTGDLTGEVIENKKVPTLTESAIKEVLSSLIGVQEQLPPMTSAIKVNGVPLYKMAHQGIEIARKTRKIEVYEIKLVSYENDIITFACDVSKGTYIRTLGETIAEKLGTVGHLLELRRTKVGRYFINNATKIDTLNETSIIDINKSLPFMPSYNLNSSEEKIVLNGGKLSLLTKDKIVAVYGITKKLLAVYQKEDDGFYHCLRGIQNEND